jgi:hypothetical protein
MLLKGLKHAVSTCASERHVFQSELLEMIRGVLQECIQDAERNAKAAETEVEKQQEMLEGEQVSASTTLSALQDADAKVSTGQECVENKKAEHTKARAAMMDPEKLKQKVLSKQEKLKQAYEKAKNIADGSLHLLSQGGWEDDEVRDAALHAVSDLLKHCSSAEGTLVTAAPHAFAKKPEQRQTFDKFIEQSVLALIAEEVEKRHSELSASHDEAEHAKAEALGLQVIAEFAEEAVTAAMAELDAAKDASEKAGLEKAEAAKVVGQRQQEIKNLGKEKDQILKKATLLREAVSPSLDRLIAGEETAATTPDEVADLEPPQKKARTMELQENDAASKENCPVDVNAKLIASDTIKIPESVTVG